MRTVSLITASGRARPDLWGAAAASVLDVVVRLGPRWSLQWCIHADGVDPGLWRAQPWWSSVVPFTVLSSGPRSGFAPARNAALANAHGELIGALDDDDELAPGWVSLLDALEPDGVSGWAAGATVDIDPAGRVLRAPGLEPGIVPPGSVYDVLLRTGTWPWHCCAAVAKAPLLRAAGGWDDLPWCEDVSMWAAITEAAPGVQLPDVVYRLRQHEQRSTNTDARVTGLPVGAAAVHRRVHALRTGTRAPDPCPTSRPGDRRFRETALPSPQAGPARFPGARASRPSRPPQPRRGHEPYPHREP